MLVALQPAMESMLTEDYGIHLRTTDTGTRLPHFDRLRLATFGWFFVHL